jgi:cohesin complex subunit SA-1/2
MSSPLSEAHQEASDAVNETRSRRSGRVSRKPELYIEEAPASKRKRDAADDDQLDDDEDSDEEEESEAGEEELKERKAKARKTKAAAPKKPAAKRSKTNGTSVALPVRAAGKKSRVKKAKGVDEAIAEQVGGLYGRSKQSDTHVARTQSDITIQPRFSHEARRWKKQPKDGSPPSTNTSLALWQIWSTLS